MFKKLEKNIEIFRICRRFINPNFIWKVIFFMRPMYFQRKKNQVIEMLKTKLYRENSDFEEILYMLINLLKKDNRLNEMVFFYNYSIAFFKKNFEYKKAIDTYKILIQLLEDHPNIYVLETDGISLLAQFNREISLLLAANYELDESIYYLERARKIYRDAKYNIGVDSISVQIGIQQILSKRYDLAIQSFESVIKEKPHYNFQQKDMNVIMLYILTILANQNSSVKARQCFDELKKKYMNLYECKEYIFLLNIISAVENSDLDHYVHEIQSLDLSKEPVYKQLFIEINKIIVLNSRKIANNRFSGGIDHSVDQD